MSIEESAMNTFPSGSSQNVYGVTYANFADGGLQFESELAIQLQEGPVVTLRIPTSLTERMAINLAVCGQAEGCGF
ncbi:MAG: hypothetical protein ACI9EB_001907 [Pseudomonas sp.]|jgi:hypothetical protein